MCGVKKKTGSEMSVSLLCNYRLSRFGIISPRQLILLRKGRSKGKNDISRDTQKFHFPPPCLKERLAIETGILITAGSQSVLGRFPGFDAP